MGGGMGGRASTGVRWLCGELERQGPHLVVHAAPQQASRPRQHKDPHERLAEAAFAEAVPQHAQQDEVIRVPGWARQGRRVREGRWPPAVLFHSRCQVSSARGHAVLGVACRTGSNGGATHPVNGRVLQPWILAIQCAAGPFTMDSSLLRMLRQQRTGGRRKGGMTGSVMSQSTAERVVAR